MSEIVPFNYGDQEVRTLVDLDGNTWFVAADVCAVLGLSDTNKAVRGLDEDERGSTNIGRGTSGGNPTTLIISEAGLYTLLIRSRRPEAKSFRRWVTHEVLPAIRRTGRYVAPGAAEPATAPVPAVQDQFDVMRALLVGQLATVDELARQERELRAVEGQVTQLDSRVTAIESAPNWCTATAWASLRGWPQTDRTTLQSLGTRAGRIARAQGLREAKVLDIHGRYPVHRWPLAVWDQAVAELGWRLPS